MVLFSIPDIRLFWSTDERFLSQFKKGEITTFRPYSKYPPCIKDISFWTAQNGRFRENNFYDLVRDTAGDWVEDVKMVGKFRSDPCFVNLFFRSTSLLIQQQAGPACAIELITAQWIGDYFILLVVY